MRKVSVQGNPCIRFRKRVTLVSKVHELVLDVEEINLRNYISGNLFRKESWLREAVSPINDHS